jgi:heterodisulfide reductase subunit A
MATGGGEAPTESYGYGSHPAVITQMEMESRLKNRDFDAGGLKSVVMIQCVDSREEPRNYCSRVCCPTSLKHALELKRRNSDLPVTIIYRDMMSPGFSESYFTEARRAGVTFIQYEPGKKPTVDLPQDPESPAYVKVTDPLLDCLLEIRADLIVLATGIVPALSADLTDFYGVDRDRDGFFKEADSKWRPVDALKEGVFACGISLAPMSIADAIASAGASAQRALRILSHERLPSGKVTAAVRHSLCSRCECCIAACPYGARSLDSNTDRVLVNPAMCQGCGDCAVVCPNSASVVRGFTDRQVMGMIDAALN